MRITKLAKNCTERLARHEAAFKLQCIRNCHVIIVCTVFFIETVIISLLFRLQRLSVKARGTTETPIAGGLSALLVSIYRSLGFDPSHLFLSRLKRTDSINPFFCRFPRQPDWFHALYHFLRIYFANRFCLSFVTLAFFISRAFARWFGTLCLTTSAHSRTWLQQTGPENLAVFWVLAYIGH